jgi:hypothetical protein
VTGAEFDAYFDRPWRIARKLDSGRSVIAPGEAERIQAFELGQPRPVRSVRTSPWLARVAATTITPLRPDGKTWERIRVVDQPLTTYQRYGMPGLVESQAAGEDVRVAIRLADLFGDVLREDFWWFGLGRHRQFGLALSYAPDGRYLGAREVTDAVTLARYAADWDLALRRSISLNEYLAANPAALRAA